MKPPAAGGGAAGGEERPYLSGNRYYWQNNDGLDEFQDDSESGHLSSADLSLEWWAAGRHMTKEDQHELWLAGIPVDMTLMMIGIERVEIEGARYRPSPTGHWAYITPVRADYPTNPRTECDARTMIMHGDLIDLICWDIATPDSFALRNGLAEWCGTIVRDDPTPIRRNPLSWLHHGCDGLVLLTADKIRRWQLLQDCNKIVAEDEIHADQINAALNYPYPKRLVYL